MIFYINAIHNKMALCICQAGILMFLTLTVKAQDSTTIIRDTSTYKRFTEKPAVPLLYTERAKENLVSSTGYLPGTSLTSTPMAFYTNALSGRLAGLNTFNTTGTPGFDNSQITLRSFEPLILVDGIPRSLSSINPEQIESITLLKDALSTVLLGNRAGNGAMLINTKRGKTGTGYSFDITAQTSVSSSLKQRQAVSAADYAMLYNEALRNDNRSPIYTEADIQAYRDGSNPYAYPNVDWRDVIFNKTAPMSRVTLNSEGSSKKSSYFASLDYMNQSGLLKPLDRNTYSTNTDYERFIFRTNLEVELTSKLTGSLNIQSNINEINSPGGTFSGGGFTGLYNDLLNTPGNAYPVTNPDGSLGGNNIFSNNIYGQSVYNGYNRYIYNDAAGDLSLKYDLGNLLKGLWAQSRMSYYFNTLQYTLRSKKFQTFQMLTDPATGEVSYKRYGTQEPQINFNQVVDRNQQFYAEGTVGYGLSTGGNKLDLLAVYSYQNFRNLSLLPEKYNTAGLSANYSINDKYIIEAAAAYSGNSWYQPGKQFRFYPAAGVSWNIHKEGFFPANSFLTGLKLRTSYGKVGNADPGYYSYRYNYTNYGNAYVFGVPPTDVLGVEENAMPSVRVPEEALKFNLGLDIDFAKNKGYLTTEYYNNTFSGLLRTRGRASSLLGIDYPLENLGKTRYRGVELSSGWAYKIGKFGYTLGGNISFSRSTILDYNEATMPYSWMQVKGQRVGQMYGYIADGFVETAGGGPVVEGYTSVPGDLKYKDLNSDGVINQYDITAIGNNKPFIHYGFNLGANYKNFDFSVLFQGTENRNGLVTGVGEWAFENNGTGNAFEQHLNRWTPATAATATHPRLSVGTNINNNVNSTFWIQNLDFLRLRNVELAYNLQTAFLSRIKVNKVRFFLNGVNLLTFSKVKRFYPEGLSRSYPLQRVVNGGITVKF